MRGMRVKVHRVEVLVVDHDDMGAEEVKTVIENTRYPNHCMYPQVIATETREVEWSDRHPLNLPGGTKWAMTHLFNEER